VALSFDVATKALIGGEAQNNNLTELCKKRKRRVLDILVPKELLSSFYGLVE